MPSDLDCMPAKETDIFSGNMPRYMAENAEYGLKLPKIAQNVNGKFLKWITLS